MSSFCRRSSLPCFIVHCLLLWGIAVAPKGADAQLLKAWSQLKAESSFIMLTCSSSCSAPCLQAFDELLLLQRGGSTLYAGALGENSRDLITYFEKLGSPPITPGYNPATWMLENTTASVEEKQDISFAEQFMDSELKG